VEGLAATHSRFAHLPGLIPDTTNTLKKSGQVDELRAAIGPPTLARKIGPSRTADGASIDEVFRDRAGMDGRARSVGWRPKAPE
jgi:hypothetical protein